LKKQKLPQTNVNASGNHNATQGETQYNITVSADSNAPVDFNISADGPLNTSGGDEILLGNFTFDNNTVNNETSPWVAEETAILVAGVDSGDEIAVGATNYYRFWLDITAGVPPGTYNNTIIFTGSTD